MNKYIYLVLSLCLLLLACTEVTKKQPSKPVVPLDLKKGLVLHSTFDVNASAGTKKIDGTLHGAYITPEAPVGEGCVYFDGLDDYVSYPTSADYFIGDYAISIWCKWTDVKEWTRIMDFNQTNPTTGKALTWLLGRRDQGKYTMWLSQWAIHNKKPVESILDFEKYRPSDAYLHYDIEPNKWSHYVISYNAQQDSSNMSVNIKEEEVPHKGAVTLYVNGEKVYKTNYCLEPQAFKTSQNYLGKSVNKDEPFFEGMMDDFRIYKRPLSAAEVKGLYDLGDLD